MTLSATNEEPILGVDIGGTKIAVGLVDRQRNILTQAGRWSPTARLRQGCKP
jgi:predicted NBD/HSP70 family sugar kinase